MQQAAFRRITVSQQAGVCAAKLSSMSSNTRERENELLLAQIRQLLSNSSALNSRNSTVREDDVLLSHSTTEDF